MSKKQIVAILMAVLICLTTVILCCCGPNGDSNGDSNGNSNGNSNDEKITNSSELNSAISNADKSGVSKIMDEKYFAEYCNGETIAILYKMFKSKSIMKTALSKANDKTLENKRVITLSYNKETQSEDSDNYFSAKELLDNFDVNMIVPKSLDYYIKSKLKNPSTLKYASAYILAYYEEDGTLAFMSEVLFSAGNALGGTIDTKWFVIFDKEMEVDHHSNQSYLTMSYYLSGPIWEE